MPAFANDVLYNISLGSIGTNLKQITKEMACQRGEENTHSINYSEFTFCWQLHHLVVAFSIHAEASA